MKTEFFLIALLINGFAFSQTIVKDAITDDKSIEKYELIYDQKVLRIPGKSLPVGIKTIFKMVKYYKRKVFWVEKMVGLNTGLKL